MTEDASNSLPNKRLSDQPPHNADLERALNAGVPDIPDFSKNILSQLQADLQNPPPCQYDIEFISTYYDQQFHLEITDNTLLSQRIENFEKHLPACPPCHTALGDVADISDLYRQFLYRQEERLSRFDITEKVLKLYQQQATDNVVALPTARQRKPWLPVALGSVAAAMFILVTFNPFSTPNSAPIGGTEQASVDLNALENALNADQAESKMREAAIPSVNVLYESPEAYLFSSDEDDLTEESLLEPNADLSAAMSPE